MRFLLQTDCFHERWIGRVKFQKMFHNELEGYFQVKISKILQKSTKKMAELEGYFQNLKTPPNHQKNGHQDIQRFWPKLKSPQNMPFLLQTDCFHERKKFWMFQRNWKGIFNISKNPKINKKMATPDTAILAKIEKSSKHAVFASNWLFSWKNIILNVSDELEGYFQHFKKS